MGKNVQIGEKLIGECQPCFIIAEAGSNHDGKIDQAKALVDVAARCGADAVKFQTFQADRIAAKTENEVAKIDMAGSKTLHEFYANVELPSEWQGELAVYARDKGITFLSTPFDEESVDALDDIGVPAFKVASFELVHLPLIRHIARKGKPVMLSTGMASLGEIEEAIAVVVAEGNEEIILLHCGIGYPLAVDDVNLAAMQTMEAAFHYLVGYSDHTLSLAVPVAAVALGAKVIEKHFTLSRKLVGPDHGFALEPGELKAMVQGIRETQRAVGSATKGVLESEMVHYRRGRRSIFAKTAIPKGAVITPDMVTVLRPGIGLKPKYLATVVGRKAQVDIDAHEPITWDKI